LARGNCNVEPEQDVEGQKAQIESKLSETNLGDANLAFAETGDIGTGMPVSNLNQAPDNTGFSVCASTVAQSQGEAHFGTVKWRTLIDGTVAAPKEFVLGIAEFEPHGTLMPHRHAPAEFYLGLEGSGTITIDSVPHVMTPGVAIYIPGNTEHAVVAGDQGLRFAYGFAEGAFGAIEYRFSQQG
jgi:quercetin dioxygenase-like cupin family protein